MSDIETTALTEKIEEGAAFDTAALRAVRTRLEQAFPNADPLLHAYSEMLNSTDALLHLVDAALPNWTIKLQGVTSETDGKWVCTLRQTDTRDDDELIGIGRAPRLSHAILAAFLKVIALRR